MDILDIITGRMEKIFGGTYYSILPQDSSTEGMPFEYEYVDPKQWNYQRLFANVIGNNVSFTAIKTKTPLKYDTKGFIVLNDGKLYDILSVQQDYNSVDSLEVYRILNVAPGIEYVIRLSEHTNPWGMQ